MERAIAVSKNGDMGLNVICGICGVPKETLDSLKRKTASLRTSFKFAPLKRKYLGLEKMFLVLVQTIWKIGFQNCWSQFHSAAIQQRTENGGWQVVLLIWSRHPVLTLRKPEATSIQMVTSFTTERVDEFILRFYKDSWW